MNGEERHVPRRPRGPGWLATTGGALLLVGLGFGVGLVAGTAYEEPQLVADHLAGRTNEVVLEPEQTAAATPDVGAPAPGDPGVELPTAALGEGALDGEREEGMAAAEAPGAPARLDAAPETEAASGSFSIQVGAFGNERAARELATVLTRRGYPTYLIDEGEGAHYKVRVGPLGSRSEAEQLSERLKSEQRLPTWIMASGKN